MFVLRRGLVAFACVPLLLVGACGDDTPKSDGPRTPSTSTSTSASLSPSESESALPEDQRASEVEPEEFVEAWISAYDEATPSGDTTRMRMMSSENCSTCEAVMKSLEDILASGGSTDINGAVTKILSTTADTTSAKGTTRVVTELKFPAGTVKENGTSELRTFPSVTETWEFYLGVEDGKWLLLDIGV